MQLNVFFGLNQSNTIFQLKKKRKPASSPSWKCAGPKNRNHMRLARQLKVPQIAWLLSVQFVIDSSVNILLSTLLDFGWRPLCHWAHLPTASTPPSPPKKMPRKQSPTKLDTFSRDRWCATLFQPLELPWPTFAIDVEQPRGSGKMSTEAMCARTFCVLSGWNLQCGNGKPAHPTPRLHSRLQWRGLCHTMGFATKASSDVQVGKKRI